jgi:cytochrome c oxidase subunit I+III
MGLFTAASLAIAIPNGIQVFSWLATIWTGRPHWRTPLLFVAGFLVIFVLGGLTGVMVAAVPFDWQVHDTHFVVAHFHYVLIGGVIFPFFAALYYWLPKITGRLLNERLGAWNAGVMFVFFNLAFFPMHISGLLGMPRRVYTYPAGLGLEVPNLLSTIGAVGFAVGILLFVVNFVWSLRRGRPAGADPWGGDTLEWSQSSPPPQAQFPTLPVVRSRHPLWEQTSLDPEHPSAVDTLAQMHWRPVTWRGALVTGVMRGEPQAVVHIPRRSWWPFTLAVAFVFLFAGLLLDSIPLLAIGGVISAGALTGWFWPSPTSRHALAELGNADREDLPLATAGPASNGWWGAIVALMILGTALLTLIGSHFYLGLPPGELVAAGGSRPLVVTGLAFALGAAGLLLFRRLRRQPVEGHRGLLVALLPLGVASLWLTISAYRELGLHPADAAHDSMIAALFAFQWLTLGLLLCVMIPALAWAWRSPGDPRGHAPAYHAVLFSVFAALSWLAIAATVYLGTGG